MTEARGHDDIVTCFMDVNYTGHHNNRMIQTVVLMYMNMCPINWYRNNQPTMEKITSSAEFCAMKAAFEMVE